MDIPEWIDSQMIGRGLASVERSEHEWLFCFSNELRLWIACPWRIVVEGRIALSDEDHAQQFGLPEPVDGIEKAKTLLLGKVISGVATRTTGDLTINFEGQIALEIWNNSSGYEGWRLVDNNNNGLISVVATGGGELVFWTANPNNKPN
ncbi:MAG TPA: DUF6188 family protein [Stellaceae bacterium]